MRLLSFNEFTGVSTFHDYRDGVTTIKTVQDITPNLEANKAAQNDGTNGYVDSERVLQRVAHIPNEVVTKWLVEEGINVLRKDHWPAVVRKLNDIDHLHLRTVRSRLAVRPHD